MTVDGDETTAAITATPAALEVIHRLSAPFYVDAQHQNEVLLWEPEARKGHKA